jgi:cytidyltransferase-like protein
MVVIYTSGVFDMCHYGHIKYLKLCRKMYPDAVFIVGVHSDADCARVKRTPIMTMNERGLTLRELDIADQILESAPLEETAAFYEKYNIAYTLHAHRHSEHEYYVRTYYEVAERMGKLVRLDYTPVISTTELIMRCQNTTLSKREENTS